MKLPMEHDPILVKILEIYADNFSHNGYSNMGVEMRFLRRGQKEIIIHCGKDFRFVVDYPGELA